MKQQPKITLLTSIGSGLEYYDYVIYALFASFISQNFFPSTSRVAALFATFGVFAVGNIIRPLGGIILGILGDRSGRKKVFSNTLFWMGIATFLMGITPAFSTIGIAATISFSLCRILQGIVCGAEIPGATTFLLEHTDTKRHGLHFGFMSSAVGLGSTLGLFIAWVLSKTLSSEQLLEWGFRVPFILGGTLALVGFFIRKNIPETPAFLSVEKSKQSFLTQLNAHYFRQIVNTIGMLIFPACLVMFFLTLPVYLHYFYHYSFSSIYLAMTVGSLWTALLLPVFGWISDYLGRKVLLFSAGLLFLILGMPVFALLKLEKTWALFSFVLFGKTLIAAMAASYFVLLPQSFGVVVRYTGTAFSYNIAYSIAALIPLAANYSYEVLKKPNYMIGLLMLLAITTLVSVILLPSPKN